MSLDELKKEIPGIDWDAFLNGIGVKKLKDLLLWIFAGEQD